MLPAGEPVLLVTQHTFQAVSREQILWFLELIQPFLSSGVWMVVAQLFGW